MVRSLRSRGGAPADRRAADGGAGAGSRQRLWCLPAHSAATAGRALHSWVRSGERMGDKLMQLAGSRWLQHHQVAPASCNISGRSEVPKFVSNATAKQRQSTC